MSAASTAAFVVAGLVMTGAAFRRARRPDVLARLAGTDAGMRLVDDDELGAGTDEIVAVAV